VASVANALYSNTEGFHNTATGAYSLYANLGAYNTASGYRALASNIYGYYNPADGVESLASNTSGFKNTAAGLWALLSNTTGGQNTAVGFNAGANVTTGFYNVHVGADVTGTAADSNTIRVGLPYSGGVGQNRTFIAGIYGTVVPAGVQVVIDANGQLGVQPSPGVGGVSPTGAPVSGMTPTERDQVAALQTMVEAQQATIAALQARLVRLEALVPHGRK
jgi:hypothetical protein